MWDQFVDTSTLYGKIHRTAREFGYWGGCPTAKSIGERLITRSNYAGGEEIDAATQIVLASLWN